jgi:SAM-dependent methyltransferase
MSGLAAGAVFDRLAPTYDRDFTNSLTGRAQRQSVWKFLLATFPLQANLLELNCGTGEDALFLASHGRSVFACDASTQMIARAEQRLQIITPPPPVVFCQIPTERIGELNPGIRFDGAFSNFSGLNCVQDLAPVATALANLIKPGDKLLLCFSTRICLVEILFYLATLRPRKALRRARGVTEATLEGGSLTVFYPTLSQLRRTFAPHFKLTAVTGVGVAIPPSYLEPWARRHTTLFRLLLKLEPLLAPLPIFRTTGDHMLLCFEKVTA